METSCPTSQQTGCSSIWFHSIAADGTKGATRAAPSAKLPVLLVHGREASQPCSPHAHLPRQTATCRWWRCFPCKSHAVRGARRGNRGAQRNGIHLSDGTRCPKNNNIPYDVLTVKSEPVNQKGTCLGTPALQLSISLNHCRGPWLHFGPRWLAVSQKLPGKSLGAGTSQRPLLMSERFLISLSFLTAEHCDEFMHLGNRSNFPTFWRQCLCVASLSLSKMLCKISGYVFFQIWSRETEKKFPSSHLSMFSYLLDPKKFLLATQTPVRGKAYWQ